MAAINYDDYGDHESVGTLALALNWIGAFLSVVLIAGLATWGWKLWVRDVTGIPVVQALEGPMRVAPEDPGGVANEYQGLAVNRIAEERIEAAPSDRVVLAPAPATLDEGEDLAMAELPAVPADDEVIELEAANTSTTLTPTITPSPSEEVVTTARIEPETVIAPAARPQTSSITLDADEAVPSATDLAVAAALGNPELKPEPAVVKVEAAAHVPVVTPRPLVRPSNLQLVSLAAPAAAPVEGEVQASAIPVGTRLVQFGAFPNADEARAAWATIDGRFSDYMVGKDRVVQEASSGGRTFYRLRAMGFADLADARRFCSVLVTDGVNCIPVVQQ